MRFYAKHNGSALLMSALLFLLPFSTFPASADESEMQMQVEKLVDTYLTGQWPDATIQWHANSSWKLARIKAEQSLSITSDDHPRGKTVLILNARSENGDYFRVPLSVTVSVNAEVPIIRERHQRLDEFNPADLLWEIRDISRSQIDFPKHLSELEKGSWRYKRPARAGSILTWQHLEQRPMVETGDEVLLIAKVGGVTVRTHGIAKSDGRDGEVIMVENPATGKSIRCLVQDKKTVLVQP